MKTNRFVLLVLAAVLAAGAATLVDSHAALAQQATTKPLTIVWGPATSSGSATGNITLVRLINNLGGTGNYQLSISAGTVVCNIKTADLEQAIALQTRITAPNTTRVECVDYGVTGRTSTINLSYPLAATQGLVIDASP